MTFAEQIRNDEELGPNFTYWRHIKAAPPDLVPIPQIVDPRIARALSCRGISELYSHQAEALEAGLAGEDVVVVTPTASGKTLCYNLPVLQSLLDDPEARALYLFPTKALAQDQLDELHGLIGAIGVDLKTFTYDGDTPGDARRAVRTAGHVVITNPDMLHTGILPHHTKWMNLFENLRYVVIDELHQYRGVFGSHVANVIRRLRRICQFYGSSPTFICCSATIANPGELAEGLIGGPVRVVDKDGSPRRERVVAIYNPPVVNRELGIRRSAMKSAKEIAERLIRLDVQTIVFAPSRVMVEVLLRRLRDSFRALKPGEREVIYGYRSGYLPLERREVEAGLRSGEIRGVVATNALELGIDIGGLDAAVLLGYPGTIASAVQQMGRAGRSQALSLAVLVANSTPVNQYLVRHPEFLFEGPVERGTIDPDNLVVRVSHLKCAAFEVPFEDGEEFGSDTAELLEYLDEEDILHRAGGRYHWMAESYPAEQVSLRSASIDNFVIIEDGPKPRVIGEMDRPSAPLLIHDEAIYMHGGQQYHVDRLDWEEKKAYVTAVDVDYYTDANLAVDLKVLEQDGESLGRNCERFHGDVAITWLATIFKKLKLDTLENIGWGKIHLPQEDVHTTAYWVALSPESREGLSRGALQAGLWGMSRLAAAVAPLFVMCDQKDLQAVAQVQAPFTGAPTMFLYERNPGGVGLAKGLFDAHDALLAAALDLVSGCSCKGGCPSCVGPGPDEHDGGKAAAITLLRRLTTDATA